MKRNFEKEAYTFAGNIASAKHYDAHWRSIPESDRAKIREEVKADWRRAAQSFSDYCGRADNAGAVEEEAKQWAIKRNPAAYEAYGAAMDEVIYPGDSPDPEVGLRQQFSYALFGDLDELTSESRDIINEAIEKTENAIIAGEIPGRECHDGGEWFAPWGKVMGSATDLAVKNGLAKMLVNAETQK